DEDITRRRRRDDNLRMVVRPTPLRMETVDGSQMTAPPHNPRVVARMLEEVAGAEAVFSCDIGNHMLFTAQGVAVDHVSSFHVDLGLGGMGSGLGGAIGLQIGYGPRRRVVAVIGDGGLLMSGNEIATCVAHRVPLIIVVFNDGQLGMVKHGSEAVYGRSFTCTLPPMDICGYAASLGADSMRIESLADLRAAFARRPRPTGPPARPSPTPPSAPQSAPAPRATKASTAPPRGPEAPPAKDADHIGARRLPCAERGRRVCGGRVTFKIGTSRAM